MDNNQTAKPQIAAHTAMREWVASHEILLSSALLTRPVDEPERWICGLFVSRDERGDFLIRLCEGTDDRCMRWVDDCRTPAHFGRRYADSVARAWVDRLLQRGWQVTWQARNTTSDPRFSLISVAA